MWRCPNCQGMSTGKNCDFCGAEKPSKRKKKVSTQEGENLLTYEGATPKAEKKLSKKAFLAIIISVAVLVVGGITAGIISYINRPVTPELVVERARKQLKKTKSVRIVSINGLDIRYGEEHNQTYNQVEMDVDVDDKVRHMKITSVTGNTPVQTEAYVQLKDTVSLFINNGSGWVKRTNVTPDQMNGISVTPDISTDFDLYFDAVLNSGQCGMTTQDLDGKICYELSSPVTITSMDMAKQFGIDSFINEICEAYEDPSLANDLVPLLGPVMVNIYIEEKTFRPLGYVVDMKKAVNTMYLNLGIAQMEVIEARSATSYTNYDELGNVVIPIDAVSAPAA